MPADRAAAPARPVPLGRLLAGRAPEPAGDDPAGEITAGRPVVVLDDDPTGTQTTAGLPVLTSWAVEDVEWAFRRGGAGFFVLTNTRSLAGPDAARRTREVARAVHEAAGRCGLDYALASRGDSTLRGHFPLETDVLAEELGRAGTPVDGLLVAPAFVEPGRLTVDGVHWTRATGPDGAAGMVPVAQSEFARDATFGYAHSDLRDWIEERTAGRVRRADVATITLDDLRTGGPDRVRDVLAGLRGGRPVVADAASDADLRVLALGVARAEAGGTRLLYRVGPSFVRARTG
ncbi:MAG: hypothetical protein NTW05_09450, partial [Pseudonocardiales bacterium]|nr:hypothetical protein [Pseudonocardiales bacterium]